MPAGLPPGIPGIGLEMLGAMQQAPQSVRQSMTEGWRPGSDGQARHAKPGSRAGPPRVQQSTGREEEPGRRAGNHGEAMSPDGSLLRDALPRGRLLTLAALLAAAGALWAWEVDPATLHREAARLPAGPALALLVVLPLAGFPAAPLHLAAGIRFGAGRGLGLVALSILLQLAASQALAGWWRRIPGPHVALAAWGRGLPRSAHPSLCLLAALLPGVPYSFVNYGLPLAGVRPATCIACTLPVHVARASVVVLLGDQSDRLTPARIAALGAYALVILGLSAWAFRRLRARLAGPPPAAGGPTRGA